MRSRPQSIEQVTWCCGIFKGWFEAAGERGIGLVIDRQQLTIAPDGLWTALDLLAGDVRFDGSVVVCHLEWAEAQLADVQRRQVVEGTALAGDGLEGDAGGRCRAAAR